jgi:hypothetical protein
MAKGQLLKLGPPSTIVMRFEISRAGGIRVLEHTCFNSTVFTFRRRPASVYLQAYPNARRSSPVIRAVTALLRA